MARTYMCVPFEFLDEVAELTEDEVGRLIIAMLKYAKTGEDTKLPGAERILFPGMKARENRFQEGYNEISAKRSEAGKKGGRPRKDAVAIVSSDSDSGDDRKANESKKSKCFSEKQMKANESKKSQSNQINSNQIDSIYLSSSSSPKDKSDDEKLMDDLRDKYGLGEKPQLALVKNSIPSVEQIGEYCKVNGYTHVIPAAFHAYYERKKWKLNGEQIERWWTVVDAWEKNPQQAESTPKHESSFDTDEFLSLALKRSFK